MRRLFRSGLIGMLVAVLLGSAATAIGRSTAKLDDTSVPAPAAADVDQWWHGYLDRSERVRLPDGRHLTLFCEGQGTPVVVLDIGLGGGAWGWSTVQDRMARQTRVCSYDRAGYSASDPAAGPRGVEALASDLHALLTAAHVAGPYVLVGQSIAGPIVGVFAQQHPASVAGLVFVDPSSGHQTQRMNAIEPALDDDASRLATATECAAAADRGAMLPGSAAEKTCVPDPARYHLPPFATSAFARWAHGPNLRARLAEMRGIDLRTLAWPQGAQVNAPVLVLTSTDTFTKFPTAGPLQAEWTAMHDRIARTSSHGLNCVVPHSAHSMMFSNPDVVIDAVAQMVRAVRTRDPAALSCDQ